MPVEYKILSCVVLVLILLSILLYQLNKNLFKGFLFFLLGIALIELFYPQTAAKTKPERNEFYLDKETTTNDYYFGYRLMPNVKVGHRKYLGDRLVFDVVYEQGEDGLRSCEAVSLTTRNQIQLFGGSEIYGVGLNNQQTLACRLNQHYQDSTKICLNKRLAINKGAFHFDFNHFLAHIDSLKPTIRGGAIVYTLRPSDLDAFVGSKTYIQERGDKAPYYEWKDSILVRKSNFLEGRSILTGSFKLFSKINLLQALSYYSKEDKLQKLLRGMNQSFSKKNLSIYFIFINDKDEKWDKASKSYLFQSLSHKNRLIDLSHVDWSQIQDSLYQRLDTLFPAHCLD